MTDDDKKLVERLRSGDYYPDGDVGYHEISPGKVDALCEQAADHIEAQAAEIARLREVLQSVTPPPYFGESEQNKAWYAKARAALEGTSHDE